MWIGIWVPVPEALQATALWIWWNFVPAFVRRELTRWTFGPPLPRGLFNKKRGGEMKRVITWLQSDGHCYMMHSSASNLHLNATLVAE